MVIASAKTGRDNRRRRAVSTNAQTNEAIRSNVISVDHILITVVIKFTALRVNEIPAMWNEKLAKASIIAHGERTKFLIIALNNS